MARGLKAGKQQHGALREQLDVALDLAPGLGLHQAAYQIVAGRLAFQRQQGLKIAAHGQQAGLGPARLLPRGLGCADEAGKILRPGHEVIVLEVLDAQQQRDHAHRQRPGDRLDEIEAVSALPLVEQFSDRLFDMRNQPLKHIHPKARIQHLADARVVRCVEKQQGAGKQLLKAAQFPGGVFTVLDPATGTLRGKARITQHQFDIGMACQQPGTAKEFLAPVDRTGLPQGVVSRVRVGQERGIHEGTRQRWRPQVCAHGYRVHVYCACCAAGRTPWGFNPRRSNSWRSRSACGLLVVSSLSP